MAGGDVVYKLFATLSLDDSDFQTGLNNSAKSVQNSGIPKAAKTVGRAVNVAFAAASVGIGAFAKSAISAGMDFDAGMSRVKAISGATDDEFQDLRDMALEMGRTTKFTAVEATEALNYMAMAGWDAGEMLAGLEGIMDLAAAAGEDLGTVSDIVTDALTAFGLGAEYSSHFADVLAAAAANSNTNVGMMGETFKYVAPVAGTLGFNIEDVAVAIGLMASSGIKASMAGTSLRAFLTRLAKPTDETAAAMEALGVSLDDGEGHMNSLMDIMNQLRTSFTKDLMISTDELTSSIASLNEQLDSGAIDSKEYDSEMENLMTRAYGAKEAVMAQFAAMLGGQRAMSGLLAIVNATDESYGDLIDSIYGADGAAKTMKETMLDNLAGDITYLKSAWEGFKVEFSDKLAPELRKVMPRITEAVGKMTAKLADMDFSKLADGIANVAEKAIGLIDYLITHSDEVIRVVTSIANLFLAGKGLTFGGKVIKGTAEIGGWLGNILNLGGGGAATAKTAAKAATAATTKTAAKAATAAAGGGINFGSLLGGASAAALPATLLAGLGFGLRDYVSAQKEAVEAATMDSNATLAELAANLETQKQLLAEAKENYKKAEEAELWASMSGEVSGELSKATAQVDAAEAAVKTAQAQYDEALKATQDNATASGSAVSETLGGLAESASGWGTDMMASFANGLTSGANSWVIPAVTGVANMIASMLHHSEPDTGPLAHDSEWMPDMMRGFAQGIRDNAPEVQGAIEDAFDVRPSVGMDMAGGYGRGIYFAPTINVSGAGYDNQGLAEMISNELKYMFDREVAAYA